MPTKVTTPVGRIIWSSGNSPLDQAEVIDDKTKQPKLNPDGTKVYERGFGLAIPKSDAGFVEVWNALTGEAAKVCNGAAPAFPNSGVFAYKLIDGDGMDKGDLAKGRQPQPYSKREGYGGCWVLTIKSSLPNAPTVYDGSSGAWLQVDPNNIRGNKLKVGDYVKVGLSVNGHLGQSPGLYLNPDGIMFIGFGVAISRGPDAETMFGAAPGASMALPPGASATPVGPAGAPPAMPGLPPAAPPAAPGLPPAAPGLPGNPTAPAAVPPVAPPAAPGLPGQIASPGNLAPALPGFASGAPQLPGGMPATPPAAPPAAPPVAPTIAVAGYDQATGKPWGIDPATGASVWL